MHSCPVLVATLPFVVHQPSPSHTEEGDDKEEEEEEDHSSDPSKRSCWQLKVRVGLYVGSVVPHHWSIQTQP